MATETEITNWLDSVYKRIFPDAEIQRINGTGILQAEMQKAGIDIEVLRKNIGYSFYIDEKIRYEEYEDILLEEYSKWEQKIPGWLENDNATDFISYVKVQSRRVYLLPYQILRLAYLKYKEKWLEDYKRVFAPNLGYTTSNIPVPWEVLRIAMCNCMLWKPVKVGAATPTPLVSGTGEEKEGNSEWIKKI